MALPDESKQPSITETSSANSKPLEPPHELSTTQSPEESTETGNHEQDPATHKPDTPTTKGQAADGDESIDYPHGAKLAVILVALCLAVFLVALDQTIISTAIPKITDHFNSIQDIGWYGSSYLLTATALQPTFGRIYTIFSVSVSFCARHVHTILTCPDQMDLYHWHRHL
jgi:hypothetical protein